MACARRRPAASWKSAPISTIAADGRESLIRREAGLEVIELGAPMDVLWLRLTKHASDPHETFGYIRDGRIMALIDRSDYWQAAYVIPKGTLAGLHDSGLPEFRAQVAAIVPFLSDRVDELKSWNDVKLLTVRVNRLKKLVPTRIALHRRRGARHVADRRRRYQSRDSGRRRCIEHARPSAAQRQARRERPARGAAPA